jgi:tyrosyl-tRNA synthetase
MLLEACAEAPMSSWSGTSFEGGGLALVDALVDSRLTRSKSEARTVITQGGAYVNGRRVQDVEARLSRSDLLFDRYLVLQRGRDYHLVSFG